MANSYLERRLEIKQLEYEDKKDSLKRMMDCIDNDTFERNAISLLSSMLELKATINELKLCLPINEN